MPSLDPRCRPACDDVGVAKPRIPTRLLALFSCVLARDCPIPPSHITPTTPLNLPRRRCCIFTRRRVNCATRLNLYIDSWSLCTHSRSCGAVRLPWLTTPQQNRFPRATSARTFCNGCIHDYGALPTAPAAISQTTHLLPQICLTTALLSCGRLPVGLSTSSSPASTAHRMTTICRPRALLSTRISSHQAKCPRVSAPAPHQSVGHRP